MLFPLIECNDEIQFTSGILDGNLTFSSLYKKLAKIVDDELKKPYEKMDERKIIACECLLWELHSFRTKHINLGLGKEEGLARLQETLRIIQNDDTRMP